LQVPQALPQLVWQQLLLQLSQQLFLHFLNKHENKPPHFFLQQLDWQLFEQLLQQLDCSQQLASQQGFSQQLVSQQGFSQQLVSQLLPQLLLQLLQLFLQQNKPENKPPHFFWQQLDWQPFEQLLQQLDCSQQDASQQDDLAQQAGSQQADVAQHVGSQQDDLAQQVGSQQDDVPQQVGSQQFDEQHWPPPPPPPPLSMRARSSNPKLWLQMPTLTTSAPKNMFHFIEQRLLCIELRVWLAFPPSDHGRRVLGQGGRRIVPSSRVSFSGKELV